MSGALFMFETRFDWSSELKSEIIWAPGMNLPGVFIAAQTGALSAQPLRFTAKKKAEVLPAPFFSRDEWFDARSHDPKIGISGKPIISAVLWERGLFRSANERTRFSAKGSWRPYGNFSRRLSSKGRATPAPREGSRPVRSRSMRNFEASDLLLQQKSQELIVPALLIVLPRRPMAAILRSPTRRR